MPSSKGRRLYDSYISLAHTDARVCARVAIQTITRLFYAQGPAFYPKTKYQHLFWPAVYALIYGAASLALRSMATITCTLSGRKEWGSKCQVEEENALHTVRL